MLSCVRFGADAGYLPKEGEMVLVRGSPNYYVKGGRFSFNVAAIEPYGQGVLYQKFLELKEKLESEGLFDEKNKQPLPKLIKKIGVVTSEDGAVLQDIIDITGRRNPMLSILLYPAKVQGIGAEQTIAEGLYALDKTDVDVIIVARGGGSLEDLSCFNTETVARAIFAAKKPVISAVGHETDFSISDFVADVRAPTPSAAAEIVSVDMASLTEKFFNLKRKLELDVLDLLEESEQNLNLQAKMMMNYVQNRIDNLEPKLREQSLKLLNISDKMVLTNENALDVLTHKLEKYNPVNILRMGYSVVLKDDVIVDSASKINVDDDIDVDFFNVVLKCKVKGKKLKWLLKNK